MIGEIEMLNENDKILQEMKSKGFFLKFSLVDVDGELVPRCEWTRDDSITPRMSSTQQADSYAIVHWKNGNWPRHWYVNK